MDLLGSWNKVTLTQPHSEPEVVVQAVSGRQDPVGVNQDASAVEIAHGIQDQDLRTRTTFQVPQVQGYPPSAEDLR